MFLVYLALQWAAEGMGYFFSVIAEPSKAQLLTIVTVMLSSTISGAYPSLKDLKSDNLDVFAALSMHRWVSLLFRGDSIARLKRVSLGNGSVVCARATSDGF